jgi:hypothetical protein
VRKPRRWQTWVLILALASLAYAFVMILVVGFKPD